MRCGWVSAQAGNRAAIDALAGLTQQNEPIIALLGLGLIGSRSAMLSKYGLAAHVSGYALGETRVRRL